MNKQILVTTALLLTIGFLPVDLWSIEIGQSREDVMKSLGKPIGTLNLSNKTVLMYPQGKVEFKNEKVSRVDLLNDEEFAAQEERKELERKEWLIEREERLAARKEEGEQIKSAKLQNSSFIASSAKQRLNFWRTFQFQYPEVDVSEQIALALEAHQNELREQAAEERIAALETRVSKAEKDLQAALDENEKLRQQLDDQSYFFNERRILNTRFNPIYYPRNKVIIQSGVGSTVTHPEKCPTATQSIRLNNNHVIKID